MSRNSSGTYTLPAGNPVVSGTVITSTWGNTTMSDIATALTDSLSRTGQGSMLAGLPLFDGTSSLPGLTYGTELTSGLYRNAAGDFRWVVSTVELLRMNTNLLQLSGTAPAFRIFESNASADQRNWDIIANNGELHIRILLDNLTATNVIDFTRSSGTSTGVTITSNTITTVGAFVNNFAGAIATPSVSLASTQPVFELNETDGATNEKKWAFLALSTQLQFRVVNDAGSASTTWLTVDRTATTVDSVVIQNTTLFNVASFSSFTAAATTSGEPLGVSSADPRFAINETDAAANNRLWWVQASGQTFSMRVAADDRSTSTAFLSVTRSGNTVNSVTLAATTVTWTGQGQLVGLDSAPTWTAKHTFQALGTQAAPTVTFVSARPIIGFFETDAAANNALWEIDVQAEQFTMTAVNDAGSASTAFMVVDRSNTTIDSITFTTTSFRLAGTTTATTIGLAGGAAALPATPTGYLTVQINGSTQKIPYYAP